MKISKFALCVTVLLSLLSTGCERDKSYVIEGSVYGGRNFEDEIIYLVPFAGGMTDKIDSAVIHEGHFRFEGEADHDVVYYLRMRPMMRLFIDELVIIKEPGHLRTRLSRVSYAKGTPQNDSLQNWRDYKSHIDSVKITLNKQLKRAEKDDPARAAFLKAQMDSLSAAFNKRNRETAARNDNAFGEYIARYFR